MTEACSKDLETNSTARAPLMALPRAFLFYLSAQKETPLTLRMGFQTPPSVPFNKY